MARSVGARARRLAELIEKGHLGRGLGLPRPAAPAVRHGNEASAVTLGGRRLLYRIDAAAASRSAPPAPQAGALTDFIGLLSGLHLGLSRVFQGFSLPTHRSDCPCRIARSARVRRTPRPG
jgi:hypothetical protein